MALGDIIPTVNRELVSPDSRMYRSTHLVIFSFTAGQAAAGERIIHTTDLRRCRRLSAAINNEDPAVAVTVNGYVSNVGAQQLTLLNIQANSVLTIAQACAAGTIEDMIHNLCAANQIDEHDLLSTHPFIYWTATVLGVTGADTMALHIHEES